jgi:hypothetical protein
MINHEPQSMPSYGVDTFEFKDKIMFLTNYEFAFLNCVKIQMVKIQLHFYHE